MVDAEPQSSSPESFGDRIGRAARLSPVLTWQESGAAGELRIGLGGSITLEQAPALWQRVAEVLDRGRQLSTVEVDLGQVEEMDGSCLALLVHLTRELEKRKVRARIVGGGAEERKLLALYTRRRALGRVRRGRPQNAIEQVGLASAALFESARGVFRFGLDMVLAALSSLRSSRNMNWRDVALNMERAGADAVPITLAITGLIGFVMGYQSALQLEQFGANIFVADLVGLALVREIGPLMTGIILCGRSGASFAAELGTMRVSEEVDALRTLGLMPLPHLVWPRVVALAIVGPLLCLLANAIGIAGGMLVAATYLDVTPAAFAAELLLVMRPWDVISGLIKCTAFSIAIALIACQQGLATDGGAEGVGRRTTSAVVSGLFAMILLDAIFTVLFGVLGL